MSKTRKNSKRPTGGLALAAKASPPADFDEILRLIDAARTRAIAVVNTTMIELYWSIGEHISGKIANDGWGQGTVKTLAQFIRRRLPNARGFSSQNLWRMRQFYDVYRELPKLAPLVRELSWTHNMFILGKCKRPEEREFYLRLSTGQKWKSRELERQINGALFERVVLSPAKLSAPLREIYPDAATAFKDAYLVEFLNLSKDHSEADLHRGLVEKLKQFLIELGRDFCFVGSHYPVQVGQRDFELDLLFFHRGLTCLVAIELKIEEFQPEHFGKLEFYLEALDRDVKKPHEQPTIGVLLCATKNSEVVEYALSRSMSPALVAEYQTHLPDKKLLEAKLHEFYELAESQAEAESLPSLNSKRPPNVKARKAAKKKPLKAGHKR